MSYPTEPTLHIWPARLLATEETVRGECVTYHKRTTRKKLLNM